MKKLILFSLTFLIIATIEAQTTGSEILTGSWEGAFIKVNSYQKLEIDFYKKEGKLYALQVMSEWHPTYGEFEVPVTIDSLGSISFGTGYGIATLTLDKDNLELVGKLTDVNPSISVHLKKTAKKPKPDYSLEEVQIPSSGVKLYGHFHIPNKSMHKTAIILVGGRGCYPDQTKYNLYAKVLREYGISVLAYQKRGTGNSTGDCGTAKIEDLAADLTVARNYVARHDNKYEKIGVLGISAGGWTMVKAAENTIFDFMISIVGPSTSVRDQQFQSITYGADFYNLSEEALTNLKTYTELLFESRASQKSFNQLQKLLEQAEQQGWLALLDDTDIPPAADEINNLWVRRHNYDPKEALMNYNHPYLAIYGERDWIVPYKENIALLEEYFAGKANLLKTVVAYNAEHGLEMESGWRKLSDKSSYWHFYRISPTVKIELVDFLYKNDLID